MLKSIVLIFLLSVVACAYAVPKDHPWEITAGYGNGDVFDFNDSTGVREYRAALGYFPTEWQWHGLNIGGEFSYAHLHNSDIMYQGAPLVYNNLTVVALTPVVRWYMMDASHMVQPYLEGGAGPGYLSDTQFKDRNLGIHFTFQDFFGFGAMINTPYPMLVGMRILHYSNAGLDGHNAGVTMPIYFYLGMRF